MNNMREDLGVDCRLIQILDKLFHLRVEGQRGKDSQWRGRQEERRLRGKKYRERERKTQAEGGSDRVRDDQEMQESIPPTLAACLHAPRYTVTRGSAIVQWPQGQYLLQQPNPHGPVRGGKHLHNDRDDLLLVLVRRQELPHLGETEERGGDEVEEHGRPVDGGNCSLFPGHLSYAYLLIVCTIPKQIT